MTIATVLPAYAQTAAAPKVLRWAYTMPSKMSNAFGWEWLGPEFEKRTNGRYKVEYYPSGTLFNQAAAYDSVQSGVAQVTGISVGAYEKRLPLSNVVSLPTLGFPGTVTGSMAGSKAFMEMSNKFPQLRDEYKGVRLFGLHLMIHYTLVSKKKEVTLPEHFKGMRVGGAGKSMEMVKNNGGADVYMVSPDVYMNMDKGVVDASFIAWGAIGLYKLNEIAKYYYDYPFGAGGIAMIMNEDFWKGMPPSDQNIFTELWVKAHEMGEIHAHAEVDKFKKAVYADSQFSVKKASPQEDAAWKKAATPILQDWVKMAESLGAKDPEAILAEWKRASEAYKE